MKKYRRTKLFIAGFFVLSAIIGPLGHLTPRHEIFPLFSWFLFSMVPQNTASYDVLIQERPGHVYDPPVSFSEAYDLVPSPHAVVAYRVIQELGLAEQSRDAARSEQLRRELEARFNTWPIHYELVKVSPDDPLAARKGGGAHQYEVLRSFVSGELRAK